MTFDELSEIHQQLRRLKDRQLPMLKKMIENVAEQRRALEAEGLFTGHQPVIVNPHSIFSGKSQWDGRLADKGTPTEILHSKLQAIVKRHVPGMLREVELLLQAEAKDIAIEIDSLEAQLKAVLGPSPAPLSVAEKVLSNG